MLLSDCHSLRGLFCIERQFEVYTPEFIISSAVDVLCSDQTLSIDFNFWTTKAAFSFVSLLNVLRLHFTM